MLQTFVVTLLNYLKEIAEVGILGFFVAGLFHAYVCQEAVLRLLGTGDVKSNALASVMGLVTPLCCCSAIPTALSLYRNGAGRGPACAFLIATPWFNFYGLVALSIFFGVPLALLIGLSSVVIAFLTGLLIDRLSPIRRPVPLPLSVLPASTCGCEDGCGDACCGTPPPRGDGWIDWSHHRAKLRAALTFMLDMGREIGLWILAGVVLGALIEAVVPETFLTSYLGGPRLLGLLAALVLAAIFYTDSLGSLPWVQSLLGKGLGVGSALTLLVAGVGTNLSTLGPIAKNMGRQTAILYASSIVILTGLLGLGLNMLRL